MDILNLPIGSVHCDPEDDRMLPDPYSLPCVLGGILAEDFLDEDDLESGVDRSNSEFSFEEP